LDGFNIQLLNIGLTSVDVSVAKFVKHAEDIAGHLAIRSVI